MWLVHLGVERRNVPLRRSPINFIPFGFADFPDRAAVRIRNTTPTCRPECSVSQLGVKAESDQGIAAKLPPLACLMPLISCPTALMGASVSRQPLPLA